MKISELKNTKKEIVACLKKINQNFANKFLEAFKDEITMIVKKIYCCEEPNDYEVSQIKVCFEDGCIDTYCIIVFEVFLKSNKKRLKNFSTSYSLYLYNDELDTNELNNYTLSIKRRDDYVLEIKEKSMGQQIIDNI